MRGSKIIKTSLRLSTASAAIIAMYLSFKYGLHAQNPNPFSRVINYFSFFTILTNGIVALAMALPVLTPSGSPARFLDSPPVRTAIAAYILIVGVVYHLLLAPLWDPEGLNLAAQTILHTIVPIVFVLDWLLYVKHGETPWRIALTGLALPLIYALWTLAHGAWTGFYPYPFIDVSELGYPRVLVNMAGLVLAFVVIKLLLVALDKLLASRGRSSAQMPARH